MEKKLYTITCNEEQLRLIADAVEDWSRFLAGQCELWAGTISLDNGPEIRDKLKEIAPLITPNLPQGASYGWSGAGCENQHQKKNIAMGYGIYRQIRHFFSVMNKHNDVYSSPTLTCKEQGPLIKIKEKQ